MNFKSRDANPPADNPFAQTLAIRPAALGRLVITFAATLLVRGTPVAPKLAWVRTHEPALFRRVDTVLLPKDWLRLGLTGERVSEMSDASGTLWLDVGACAPAFR